MKCSQRRQRNKQNKQKQMTSETSEIYATRTSGPVGPLVLVSYAVNQVQDLMQNYEPMPPLTNEVLL